MLTTQDKARLRQESRCDQTIANAQAYWASLTEPQRDTILQAFHCEHCLAASMLSNFTRIDIRKGERGWVVYGLETKSAHGDQRVVNLALIPYSWMSAESRAEEVRQALSFAAASEKGPD